MDLTLSGVANVAEMRVGGLTVRNEKVLVAPTPFGFSSVDGFLGWPLLCQLVVDLDKRNLQIVLSPARDQISSTPNFSRWTPAAPGMPG